MSAFDIQLSEINFSPQSIAAFLGATGWQLQAADPTKQVWSLTEDQSQRAQLLLPLDPEFVDYDVRFKEALNRICVVLDWDVQQLVTNVSSVRSDILYIRAVQLTRDETIPLRQARELLDGAASLIEAAALSSLEPKPRYVGRRPNSVRDFVEGDVRMGHTLRGSFVMTIVTRLDEDQVIAAEREPEVVEEVALGDEVVGSAALQEALAPGTQIRLPPFQRRVMSTLASGLAAAETLAQRADFSNLDRSVARGLSANLCDSLAQMTRFEGLRALDLSFRWAPAELITPPATENVTIDRDSIPQLGAISDRLKYVPERVRVTVYGQVTRLERGVEEDEGTVTIQGIEGRSTRRSVRLYLSGPYYDNAIRAHRSRALVAASGILEKRGNAYWLTGDLDLEISGAMGAD